MKVVVYAISKNEEKFVNRFCESMKEADEIYVLDTGSTDNTVKLLLENGAEVNATDNIENFTPLMYAAAEGNVEVVKILLENDADISMVDKDGDDAETFARQNNHSEIVEILQNSAK